MATSKSKHKRQQHKFSLRAKRRKEKRKVQMTAKGATSPTPIGG